MIATVWFCLVALMVALYVVFDGFDLGAGMLHLWIARTGDERRAVLESIGAVWHGNQVWLVAGGGTLYFAFPTLYASAFSGFYLPLMVLLWLLILRGIAIELRNHIQNGVWEPLWDVVFSASSALVAISFGAALGNVVRGVPLDRSGYFFLPFWNNFSIGLDAGILDPYTLLIAVSALLTLAQHGALWVAFKTEGTLELRAQQAARGLWWGVLLFAAAITVVSFRVQPRLGESFRVRPWGFVFPSLAVSGLAAMKVFSGLRAFLASCAFIIGMLSSVVFGVYPDVLPSSGDPSFSLTVYNAAAPHYGLEVGLMWFVPGILLTAGYFFYTYRSFSGKIRL